MTWSLVKTEGLAPAPRGACCCVALGTQVLVFGGADRVPVSFSDLWVLETEGGKYEWTRITPLYAPGCKVMPRSGATMTAVGDLLYLFGGTEPVSNVIFNDIKVLDPKTWTWSDVEVTGTRPPERHSHCTGCLADTCLLVYGGAGYQGPMSDVWIFNTLQNSWTRPNVSGEQPPAREMHTGVMVDPTTLLIYGGRGAEFNDDEDDDTGPASYHHSDGVLCDAALFDAKEMKWTSIEPTPFSRCAHSAVVVPGAPASASAAGGSAEGGASGKAEEAAAGSGGAATTSSGGDCRVLIYGGYSGEAVEGDVLQIDPRSLEIELVRRGPRESDKDGTVPDIRFAHSAVVVPVAGGSAAGSAHAMVVFGGVNPGEDLNDVAVWAE